MPSLGADMDAGTLAEWSVKPGDRVSKGDIVAVVETDKGAIEVECFDEGIVDTLLVEPGTRVPVGTAMAMLRSPEEDSAAAPPAPAAAEPARAEPEALPQIPEAAPAEPAAAPPEVPPVAERPQPEGPSVPKEEAGIRAVPGARKLAAEAGVELRDVRGTGEEGSITRADVERHLAARKPREVPPAKADPAVDRQAAMRRAIAAAMAKANREIPHYYLSDNIDVTETLRWLEARNAEKPLRERVLAGVLFLKAVAMAAKRVPEVNGFWKDDHFEPSAAVHAGAAIALRQGGLVAPAIRDADRLTIDELMQKLADLIGRTRRGGLRSSELSDATITVTSLGDLGVETVWGVIYPPQVALVGFGAPVERPWIHEGELAIRKVVTVTLAADHRASDGLRGAKFLQLVKRYLARPEHLEETEGTT